MRKANCKYTIENIKEFLNGQRCQKCSIERTKQTNLQIYGDKVAMNSKQLKEIW